MVMMMDDDDDDDNDDDDDDDDNDDENDDDDDDNDDNGFIVGSTERFVPGKILKTIISIKNTENIQMITVTKDKNSFEYFIYKVKVYRYKINLSVSQLNQPASQSHSKSNVILTEPNVLRGS